MSWWSDFAEFVATVSPLYYIKPNVCLIQPGKWEAAVGLPCNFIISEVSQCGFDSCPQWPTAVCPWKQFGLAMPFLPLDSTRWHSSTCPTSSCLHQRGPMWLVLTVTGTHYSNGEKCIYWEYRTKDLDLSCQCIYLWSWKIELSDFCWWLCGSGQDGRRWCRQS